MVVSQPARRRLPPSRCAVWSARDATPYVPCSVEGDDAGPAVFEVPATGPFAVDLTICTD
ncbi:hypothetical protein EF879_06015 [Micromonospora sp. HM5-17]|nr:hypothetical protein EF879_06015 [Micromonospora sp. HM5-17]